MHVGVRVTYLSQRPWGEGVVRRRWCWSVPSEGQRVPRHWLFPEAGSLLLLPVLPTPCSAVFLMWLCPGISLLLQRVAELRQLEETHSHCGRAAYCGATNTLIGVSTLLNLQQKKTIQKKMRQTTWYDISTAREVNRKEWQKARVCLPDVSMTCWILLPSTSAVMTRHTHFTLLRGVVFFISACISCFGSGGLWVGVMKKQQINAPFHCSSVRLSCLAWKPIIAVGRCTSISGQLDFGPGWPTVLTGNSWFTTGSQSSTLT